MAKLPYKVECKSNYVFFEIIAAFDVVSAADAYALDCSYVNSSYTYRITKGKKVLFLVEPKQAREAIYRSYGKSKCCRSVVKSD